MALDIEDETIVEETEITQENVPDSVVDREQYDRYIKLCKNKLLNENSRQKLSNGSTIHLSVFPKPFEQTIKVLPQKEQVKLRALKKMYMKLHIDKIAAKRRAFGLGKGYYATQSLLDTRKEDLLEYFGRMFTVQEVYEIMVREWGANVEEEAVKRFYKNNVEVINQMIEQHKRDYSHIRLGIKKSRIEELVQLFQDRKRTYFDTKNKEDYKLLLMTLEQIRKEAEGEHLKIEGSLQVNMEATINQYLQVELLSKIALKEIVIARVAVRLGLTPMELVAALQDSFYGKNVDYLGENEDDNAEIKYPSLLPLDFDQMRFYNSAQEAKLESVSVDVTGLDQKAAEKKLLSGFRDNVLDTLKMGQRNILKRKDEVTTATVVKTVKAKVIVKKK